jgi:hypothetical protein
MTESDIWRQVRDAVSKAEAEPDLSDPGPIVLTAGFLTETPMGEYFKHAGTVWVQFALNDYPGLECHRCGELSPHLRSTSYSGSDPEMSGSEEWLVCDDCLRDQYRNYAGREGIPTIEETAEWVIREISYMTVPPEERPSHLRPTRGSDWNSPEWSTTKDRLGKQAASFP